MLFSINCIVRHSLSDHRLVDIVTSRHHHLHLHVLYMTNLSPNVPIRTVKTWSQRVIVMTIILQLLRTWHLSDAMSAPICRSRRVPWEEKHWSSGFSYNLGTANTPCKTVGHASVVTFSKCTRNVSWPATYKSSIEQVKLRTD